MENEAYLDLDKPVIYQASDERRFEPWEKHIARDCKEYVLLIMLRGKLTFIERDKTCSVTGGSWYIQVPGPQEPSPEPCMSPRYYYVHFHASACKADALHRMPLQGTFTPDKIEPYLQRLIRAARLPFTSALERQTAFTDLLLSLTDSQLSTAEDSLAEKVLNCLQGFIPLIPSMEDLSARFGYSADHIAHVFKCTYGMTPTQMLMRLRLQRACALLSTSARSIQQISQECGWTSPSIFYRAFQKAYGLSPTQYRKRQLASNQ